MLVNEPCLDQNTEPNKLEGIDHEDEEDTLSFYEFAINSDADAWEASSRESQNSSFKSSEEDEDDYFEFFSEELRINKTTSYAPDNIIFCGKIIPYKQPISENPKNVVKEKNQKRRGLFRWRRNLTSSYKSRTSTNNENNGAKHRCKTGNEQKELQSESPKHKYNARKRSKVHGFSVRKWSIFTSPANSRWFFYLFGINRLRSEMELTDIKNRQSRRSLPSYTISKLMEGGDDKKSECKGGWRLIRALSCGGGHYQKNAVVQVSVGRIPPGVN